MPAHSANFGCDLDFPNQGIRRNGRTQKQTTHGRHFQDNDTRSGTPSVYHRATMQTTRPNFERWDFMEPVRRPSVLDPLIPCGLGTPLVESLASYVTRLAEAHVVSVW